MWRTWNNIEFSLSPPTPPPGRARPRPCTPTVPKFEKGSGWKWQIYPPPKHMYPPSTKMEQIHPHFITSTNSPTTHPVFTHTRECFCWWYDDRSHPHRHTEYKIYVITYILHTRHSLYVIRCRVLKIPAYQTTTHFFPGGEVFSTSLFLKVVLSSISSSLEVRIERIVWGKWFQLKEERIWCNKNDTKVI